jgi:hypothetical protein
VSEKRPSIEDQLIRIDEAIAEMRAAMATKTDLEPLVTKVDLEGVAKNVDIRRLGAQVKQAIGESRALRGDLRLLTSICNGIAVADRVSELEDEEPR